MEPEATVRHDRGLKHVGSALTRERGIVPKYDRKSIASDVPATVDNPNPVRYKTDMLAVDPSRIPSHTTLDVTYTSIYGVKYEPGWGTKPSSFIFEYQAKRKDGKHKKGSVAREREFIPLVITLHGGIGPPESLAWLERIFSEAGAAERASGRGTGSATAQRKQLFFAALQAIAVRSSTLILVQSTKIGVEKRPRNATEQTQERASESEEDEPPQDETVAPQS